jgi:hypothetical protein
MFSFKAEEKKSLSVPWFEDAKEKDGWKGHATTKSIDRLQSEINTAVSRLGGVVSGYQRGTFEIDNQKRDGFQIHYALGHEDQFVAGRLDIAALPVKDKWNTKKKEQALRMALYMVREALEGSWLLQQLSPGYAALMPWMLNQDGKTVSQLWAESSVMKNLLPPPDADFVEAEIVKE